MTLLTIAIPVALVVAAVAVAAFIWAARTDQFEDLDTPPRRILLDDAPVAGASAAGCPAMKRDSAAALPSAHARDRVPSTRPD